MGLRCINQPYLEREVSEDLLATEEWEATFSRRRKVIVSKVSRRSESSKRCGVHPIDNGTVKKLDKQSLDTGNRRGDGSIDVYYFKTNFPNSSIISLFSSSELNFGLVD